MLPVGFELTISANEGPQTYALDRAASGNNVRLYRMSQEERTKLRESVPYVKL